MVDHLRPRPHKSVEEILKRAQQGSSFMVDQAVLDGDLAQLSESRQRIIVATAHDNSAAYAQDQIVSTTESAANFNSEFIRKQEEMAIKVFFKLDGKPIDEEIKEFRDTP